MPKLQQRKRSTVVRTSNWSALFLRNVSLLLRAETLSKAKILASQRKSLTGFVRHGRATVPLYRERLDPVFRADNTIDWLKWQELPILTREEVQSHAADLLSRRVPRAHGAVSRTETSGSTGRPLQVSCTAFYQTLWSAVTHRFYHWNRVDFAGKMASIRPLAAGEAAYPEGEQKKFWAPGANSKKPSGPLAILNINTPIHQQAEWLSRQEADILHTFPTNAAALADFILRNAEYASAINLDRIVALGEVVTDEARELCKEAFGAEIIDCYSSVECGYIALECPDCHQYHVQSETVFVELLKEDGSAAEPGETGQVVVTPFCNYAMPLIRYAFGDYAVAGNASSCRRPLPAIERIIGRTRNLFRFPDGSVVQPDLKTKTFLNYLRPRQWQVAQTGALDIEVRLVPDPDAGKMDFDGLSAYIHDLLRDDLKITYRLLDEFPPARGGKHQDYVCEL